MTYFYLALAGIVGGLIGGMGMGGGTLLIPILTFIFNIAQKNAQAINLICFVPMAIIALIIHCKNNLVKFDGLLPLVISAVASSIGAVFLLKLVKSDLQTKLFGGFLILLAISRFYNLITKPNTKNIEKKDNIIYLPYKTFSLI